MRTDSYGYTNKIGDIDNITDHPEKYQSGMLRQAIHDAYAVYEYRNKSYDWYEQVWRICNEELKRRGEREEIIQSR